MLQTLRGISIQFVNENEAAAEYSAAAFSICSLAKCEPIAQPHLRQANPQDTSSAQFRAWSVPILAWTSHCGRLEPPNKYQSKACRQQERCNHIPNHGTAVQSCEAWIVPLSFFLFQYIAGIQKSQINVSEYRLILRLFIMN
jgi:hypothetical protein